MDYIATLPPYKEVPKMCLYWNGFRVITPPDRLGQGLTMIEYAKKLKAETSFTFDGWTYDAAFYMYRADDLFVPNEDNIWDKTNEMLKTINTPLGFWCSFSSIFDTPTHAWGETQGYELQHDSSYCLAGQKYFSAIKNRLEDIVRKYRMGVIDFDGMYWEQWFGCNKPDHGHLTDLDSEVGIYSLERVVENKLDIFHCLRDINPNIVLILFVCNEWASPWWLQEVDAVHTVWGDTVAADIASPWLRDELITVRDIQIFEEHKKKNRQFPLWAEDLYGTQVRKDHLIDGVMVTGELTAMRWEDEYVMALSGRGAITGNIMCSDLQILDKTQSGLKFLGEVANWTRANESIYKDFHLIGGEPRELKIYGYSHCDSHGRAIIALRNPYITAETFPLVIDESLGFESTDEKFNVNIIYPYRKTFKSVNFGEKVDIFLQDYQVIMLDVRSQSRQFKEINSPGRWDINDLGKLVKYDESPLQDLPKGKLLPLCKDDRVQLKGEVILPKSTKNGQIQIMLDPDEDVSINKPTVLIDSQQVEFEFHERTGGVKQDWILVNIDSGTHDVEIIIENINTTTVQIQSWLVANYKLDGKGLSQKAPHLKELFPVFSSDWDRRSTPLLKSYSVEKKLPPLPDGNSIFLSDLKGRCLETKVGWSEFSWDKSCWPENQELKIGDTVYKKGLSFHAPGCAKFDVDGQFKYFIVDLGLLSTPLEQTPSKKACGSSVLIVEADGQEIYRSAVLKEGQPAEHVKIDISGAKILKLICTDGGDGICDDLTVWAQARVEK